MSVARRLDIQGIRALAVLLVLVNHLSPRALPGGYTGVDVFFVVSGFLITSLLVREAEGSGRVSLGRFYARRARRILPAASVVLAATAVGSLLVLPLLRAREVLVDVVWASFFAANVRQAEVGTDYFAQGQPVSPLRHYWSLAVEEQFYLIWPLLLLGCLVWLHRRPAGSTWTVRRTAGPVLLAVVLVSLAWSLWTTHESPVTAYYSTPARIWELGAGALCALLPVRLRVPGRGWLAGAGLAAVIASAFLLSGRTPSPGIVVALPVLGTTALILAGRDGTTAVGRALAVRPLTVVGDWSYSIYLWHWPLIVLGRSLAGQRLGGITIDVAAVVLTFALSWATFRWVETPFREGRAWRPTSRALLLYPASLALSGIVVLAGQQLITHRLVDSNAPAITVADYQGLQVGKDAAAALVRASVLAARDHREVPGHLSPSLLDLDRSIAPLGDCDYTTGTHRLCPVGDPSADRTIVLLGDSHARAWAPAVDELGRTHGYKVYVLAYSRCMATSLVQLDHRTNRPADNCEAFKTWALGQIAALSPDLLLVSTFEGPVVDPSTGATASRERDLGEYLTVLRDGWRPFFERLARDAKQVYLVGNTPKVLARSGTCLTKGNPDLGDCVSRPRKDVLREAKASFEAADEAGIGTVDALDWFCSGGACPSVVGRFVTMRDLQHMTVEYSRHLAEPLAARLRIRHGAEGS
jgi:peptidoglycan/LPS O-acetylase OafA/YrhL